MDLLNLLQRLSWEKWTFGPDLGMILHSLQNTSVFMISFHLHNNGWVGITVDGETESQRIQLLQLGCSKPDHLTLSTAPCFLR